MDGLILAFSVVFPLFAFMVVGYVLRRVKKIDPPTVGKLNQLVFQLCLPLVVFLSIYNSDFEQDFSPKLITTVLCLSLITFALCMVIIPRIEPSNPKRASMIQGIYRSNFVLFGIPVAQAVYGDEAVSITAVAIAVVVPIINALSVFALEWYSDRGCDFKRIGKSMLKHPIIIAALSGLAVKLIGLTIPVLITDVMSDLSAMATPLALLALGASLRMEQLKGSWKQMVFCAVARLIACPLLYISVGIFLGFRGIELIPIFCLAASPTAVSSTAMAQMMGADYELAGQIVAATSLGAILTIFLWISVLENLHFI
ncbi:AEC family transporter [Bengtsoniella intestinalis]|uniref:AEC family transporter n=1 Tax=Bengtsoniella intestinalis TaxID=3073143 RepID=UPI00391FC7A8